MKKFAGTKSLDTIKQQCKAQGVYIDTRLHDQRGQDTVVVGGPVVTKGIQHHGWVIFNVFNGKFFGRTPKGVVFDSSDYVHEKEPWFQALLSFFYVETGAAS